jgi:tellurite resistance protein TehA-like permease
VSSAPFCTFPSTRTHACLGLGLVNSLTPVVLLIPIAPLTAATTGGIVFLYAGVSARLQVPVLVFSWWLVGAGLLLALTLYVLYLVRLMARNVLSLAQAPAALIAIGPLGQAATALLLLGSAAAKGAFAEHARGTFITAAAAQSVLATSVLLAALLQGFALFWGLFAVLELVEAVVHHRRRTGRFADGYTLAWWSLVFPICTWSTSVCDSARPLTRRQR